MKTIFLDTVGLIGLWDVRDPWHQAVESAFQKLSQQPFEAITTPLVLMECASSGARRPFRQMVLKLRDDLAENGLLIEPLSEEVNAAWEAYRSQRHGTASVVDIVSFQVMRRCGITEVLSNDRHFSAAGFSHLF